MWQRIQTLYFAIIVALLSVLVFGDVFDGVRYIGKLPYAVLLLGGYACNILSLVTFRKRGFQLRCAGIAGVLLAALQVWLIVDYFSFRELVFKWSALLPMVCVYLEILAIKGIYADELMVRSASRLRSPRRKRPTK